jgi:hypothetical protein
MRHARRRRGHKARRRRGETHLVDVAKQWQSRKELRLM